MDLFRALLLEVEKQPAGHVWKVGPLLNYQTEDVVAHARLVADAGLIEARFVNPVINEIAFVFRLTNAGFELLELVRIPVLWERAKQRIEDTGVPVTLHALKTVLDRMVEEQLMN